METINLKPNGRRAENAIKMIWLVLVAELLTLVLAVQEIKILDNAEAGYGLTDAESIVFDLITILISLFAFAAYIFSAISFIKWFRRAYFNLILFYGKRTSHGDNAAVYSWFIPFVNIVRPFKIMRELFDYTQDFLSEKKDSPEFVKNNYLIGFWWAFFLINGVLSNIIARLTLNAETITEIRDTDILTIISSTLTVPFAILTVKMIKDYRRMETLVAEVIEEKQVGE